MIGAGTTVNSGGVTSTTSTSNDAVLSLPSASLAVQVTVVTPIGNDEPDGGTSFVVTHRFRLGERAVLEGEEVRVWAEPDGEGPHGMRAGRIPDAVRAVLEAKQPTIRSEP